MADKIAVLLADSDALRRDGMTAVVQAAGSFEVVSQCADGIAALEEIRANEPEVAIIDLNLPKLHGIELIRRVRSEQLQTKVIVVSGTDDDDIIREVVRAGGDGFLLKNGPARHLLDAIQYVRDGGQYFSPHLRRDGLDRHFLEERPQSTFAAEPAAEPRPAEDRSVYGRSAGKPAIREHLRERIEEDQHLNLKDRDYEILSMMAEGIRPILDRLDDIEGRVNGMETGLEPIPQNPGGWLSRQFADTVRPGVPGRQMEAQQVNYSMRELESKLPQLIEETVSQRFHSMAGKLQKEIEESHIKTLETFVKNIQIKLVSRVSALEKDMALQAENMNQLRESSLRTEDNLSRLISGVDKLAQELPRRIQNAAVTNGNETFENQPAASEKQGGPDKNAPATARVQNKPKRQATESSAGPKKIIIGSVVAVVLIALCFLLAATLLRKQDGSNGQAAAQATGKAGETAAKPTAPPLASADTKTKMDAAEDYVRRKEYAMAEDIYRQVIKQEPKNVDAMKALASVLYRQDKIDESAAVLDKIPSQ